MDYNYAMETEAQLETVRLTPYENFLDGLKVPETKRQYPHRLDKFMSFIGLETVNKERAIQEKCTKLYDMGKNNPELLQSYIIRFINVQKQRIENRELSEGTLANYIKAIKLFCSMNDLLVINWARIRRGMPIERHSANDRIPTLEEIKQLLEHPDRRLKIIVSIMISSGIRVGSFDYLQWKHVIPIKRKGIIIAAKLLVVNTKINNRRYFTFISPEANNFLKNYIDFRELHGEKITGESWLVRDIWQRVDRSRGPHKLGFAQYPKKIGSISIRNMLYEAWQTQGVRAKLEPGIRNHEFKSSHSFRKTFETMCQKAKMNHNNIKLLMDHSLGESQNYHRPSEEDILEDYLKAVDLLTINEENRLKLKVEKLEIEKTNFEALALDIAQIKEELKTKKI
jgi:integrase